MRTALSLFSLKVFFNLVLLISAGGHNVLAHEFGSQLQYLGNEGVLYTNGKNKVLFDPFFHNSYGSYTLVPAEMRQRIFNNQAPFDNVDSVFISHAHGDHFDAEDVVKYLKKNKKVKLFAPLQAVNMLAKLDGFTAIQSRVTAIDLQRGDKPHLLKSGSIEVAAIRIPHSGWPKMSELQNIIFQVSLSDNSNVLHLGDSDSKLEHFNPHKEFWQTNPVNTLLPPFWFAYSDTGVNIGRKIIGAKQIINLHVPTKVPEKLKRTGEDYFSKPGEIRQIKTQ